MSQTIKETLRSARRLCLGADRRRLSPCCGTEAGVIRMIAAPVQDAGFAIEITMRQRLCVLAMIDYGTGFLVLRRDLYDDCLFAVPDDAGFLLKPIKACGHMQNTARPRRRAADHYTSAGAPEVRGRRGSVDES